MNVKVSVVGGIPLVELTGTVTESKGRVMASEIMSTIFYKSKDDPGGPLCERRPLDAA